MFVHKISTRVVCVNRKHPSAVESFFLANSLFRKYFHQPSGIRLMYHLKFTDWSKHKVELLHEYRQDCLLTKINKPSQFTVSSEIRESRTQSNIWYQYKWSRNQTWNCTNFRIDDSFYWRIIMTWRYFQYNNLASVSFKLSFWKL